MSTTQLTARQQEVLKWIKNFIETNGYPPTRSEVAKGMKFASSNAAQEHLAALERKNALTLVSGVARGIVLAKPKALASFMKSTEGVAS